ncbi:MAG: metallophosphoesterase [Isosphaeraceae bacterium]|nr:metallophosphoesterase [Isosphaeraceae bacterium]
MTPPNPPVTFVVPGDLHLTEPGLDNHRVALWMADEVNTLIRPDFVQFIGDNVQDATEDQFRLFDDLCARIKVPIYALVGDHDVKDDPQAQGFRARVGETYGASSLRGYRFIRLDTQQARPLGLSARQVHWFRNEVDAALAAGETVVVFQHNYPYQIWEDFAGPGIDDWRAIVHTRRIGAIITGHTHYGQVANDGNNVVVAVRSIGDPEGGPPGYAIGYLHGEDFAITYRSVDDSGPVVLVTHPRDVLLATGPRHIIARSDQYRVKSWSMSLLATIRGRLDDGPWFPLEPSDAGEWVAPLPGERLAKGEHVFEVEAVDDRDRCGGQRISFMVDPTGRYTAVPSVRPRVTATCFC